MSEFRRKMWKRCQDLARKALTDPDVVEANIAYHEWRLLVKPFLMLGWFNECEWLLGANTPYTCSQNQN